MRSDGIADSLLFSYTERELFMLLTFVQEYEKEVLEYLGHAERTKDMFLLQCYRCQLDLLRTQEQEVSYVLGKKARDRVS